MKKTFLTFGIAGTLIAGGGATPVTDDPIIIFD